MGKYTDKNLIRYEDAIQLHFDKTGMVAWLTMKNYGLVFHAYSWARPWNEVKEVTIGIPAGTFLPEESAAFAETAELKSLITPSGLPLRAIGIKNLELYLESISISVMFDAIQVIKFQVEILKVAQFYSHAAVARNGNAIADSRKAFTRLTLLEMIRTACGGLGWLAESQTRTWFANTLQSLRNIARVHGDPLWIDRAIRGNALGKTGLTAYFPRPELIVQEQRTAALIGNLDGKTKNQDMRYINPISYASSTVTNKAENVRAFSFDDFFAELDRDRIENEQAFLNKNPDREAHLPRYQFPRGVDYLHQHISRINCYGFRGDKRDPASLRRAGGFLAGITRTDKGVEMYQSRADELDRVLKLKQDWNGKLYREAIKKLDILTLGVFTKESDFKGFISVSTSTAIAKCFANKYSEEPNLFAPTNCYAIRCKDGFHLPTNVSEKRSWDKKKDAQNAMTHFAEQEVAVTGRIGWEDVVGMRVIRTDKKGQFFAGPVFMQDALRNEYEEALKKKGKDHTVYVDPQTGEPKRIEAYIPQPDDDAFAALFDLFSGKSQGEGFEIEWSYQVSPFDCPEVVWQARDQHKDFEWK